MRAWNNLVPTAVLLLLAACADPTAVQSRGETEVEARRSTNGSLTVSISGPAQVAEGDCESWFSTVSGGTAPYQYSWSGVTTADNTSDWVQGSLHAPTPGYVYLTVQVTDANGLGGSAGMWVFVPAPPGSPGLGCA